MSEKIRILIADDHQLFRDGVKALIRSAEDLTVIGEATTGKQAVQLADQLTPDLILMDVQMPDLNGIAACYDKLNRYDLAVSYYYLTRDLGSVNTDHLFHREQ